MIDGVASAECAFWREHWHPLALTPAEFGAGTHQRGPDLQSKTARNQPVDRGANRRASCTVWLGASHHFRMKLSKGFVCGLCLGSDLASHIVRDRRSNHLRNA
jgi:hypothetical protein